MKIKSLQGIFNEVYDAAASVFASLPDAELVQDALIYGHFGSIERWYDCAQQLDDDPATMSIDREDKTITFITPTSSRVVAISLRGGVLLTHVDFGDDGSSVAAGHIVRYLKYHYRNTSAAYKTVDGSKYQVAFVKLDVIDLIYHRRDNSSYDNILWQEAEVPSNWPAIEKHITESEYNRYFFPGVASYTH